MKFLILNVVKDSTLLLKLFEKTDNRYVFKKDVITTLVFNYQQGIRAMWLNNKEIIFNCMRDNQLVSSVYNIESDTKKYFPYPFQEAKGRNIFCLDYNHLDLLNKDYGYDLQKKGYYIKNIDGILAYDIDSKDLKFHLDKRKIHKLSMIKDNTDNCEINHINASPFDDAIIFIYRNKGSNSISELYWFCTKGNNLRRIFSGEIVSHYCWLSANQILVYLGKKVKNQGYYLIQISGSKSIEIKSQDSMNHNGDGHPSLCPNNRFIVYDSYPDRNRYIHLNIYDTVSKKAIKVGEFFSPLKYSGFNRCDLHPRWSPDGTCISIDSCHSGLRKHYIIEVSNMIKKNMN
tara:strand:- start:7497 stop:8531 length:1035 start_codon:yes stop_codon:yes gene_type:complete